MRIELPRRIEHFGAVRIHGIQKVYQLDSGSQEIDDRIQNSMFILSRKHIEDIERNMAIIIPIKNERVKLLEGTLSAIPQDCLTIIISNSSRKPVDRFKIELGAVEQYTRFVPRSCIVVHQKDTGLSELLAESGYKCLLSEEGLIRDGKAEGMILGMIFAWLENKKYVGFIDADNYVPGAVYEYVKNFVAGFSMTRSPYSMVRVSWVYKPKFMEGAVFFKRLGRISKIGDKYLNALISSYTGFETEIVRTANAGDHAMSMALARVLKFSHGFSIEPYELVNIFEQFAGILPPSDEDVMDRGVEIFQIETRNPHFHEDKGKEHLNEMLRDLLSVIYHSPICPKQLREEIEAEYRRRKLGKDVPKPLIYPPIKIIDIEKLREEINEASETFHYFPSDKRINLPKS